MAFCTVRRLRSHFLFYCEGLVLLVFSVLNFLFLFSRLPHCLMTACVVLLSVLPVIVLTCVPFCVWYLVPVSVFDCHPPRPLRLGLQSSLCPGR